MPYRILHLADLHLERPFSGMACQGDLGRRRRAGLRDALRRAGEVAAEMGCDLVTIGGDLLEHERAGPDTGVFLAELFSAWRPLRVALAPGNHDPLVPASLYRRQEWPDNVHVFAEPRLTPWPLADGLTLWGLAHREPAWGGDPLGHGRVADDGGLHLALFHGADLGSRPEGKSVHGPFHAERIAASGLRAVLCGHYHQRRLDAATGLIYPGSPEPLTFDETGERGPVLVEVAENGDMRWEPLALNRWWCAVAICGLEGVPTATAARDRLEEVAAGAVAGLPAERTLLRVDLRGDTGPGAAVDVPSAEAWLRERTAAAAVRVRDLTRPALDPLEAARDSTVLGAFARAALAEIDALPHGEPRAVLADALRYGLQALSGVEISLR